MKTQFINKNRFVLIISSVLLSLSCNIYAAFLPRDAILTLEASTVGDSISVRPATGSWFSMELSPGVFAYTSLSGLNHLQLGTSQPANAQPAIGNIDVPWLFVGQLGVHATLLPVRVISDPGDATAKLDFSGWTVSWAGVPVVAMNEGPDNGVASVTCTAGNDGVANCSVGDRYTLDYRATVPDDELSNKGGSNYHVHMEGEILSSLPFLGCNDTSVPYAVTSIAAGDCRGNVEGSVYSTVPGSTANAVGNVTGSGLSAVDVAKDPLLNSATGEQCAGGCVDYVVINVGQGARVNVVYKLSKPIENGVVFRKLINGKWQDFNKDTGDAIGSAAAGNESCQTQAGAYAADLTDGDECIIMSITDGGPNDADGLANGVIVDTGGFLIAGEASSGVTANSTSGCSLSGNSIRLAQRADWLLLVGFVIWLGLLVRRKQS